MADLGTRFKQTIQDQSMNVKFLQLLNSNRPIQSLKDRQILPAIPLSSFNNSVLPSIHKQKAVLKARSISEKKIKIIGDLGNPKVLGKNTGKEGQLIMASEKMILGSTKNLIKVRNRSVQSAHRSAKDKQQSMTKVLSSKRQKSNDELIQINPLNIQSSQKKMTTMHITPQKLKLDFPSNKNSMGTINTTASKNKFVNNKTIQEISNQAIENLMLNIKFGKIQQNISYKSFLKKEVQPSPIEIIKKLQQWLLKYKIKSGLLMTKNLHKIFAKKSIPNNLILQEFANYDQLKRQLENSMPGLKYYGYTDITKGKVLAATKIQSFFRMNLQKKYTKKLRSLMNKVRLIQRQWRVSLESKRGRQKIMNRISAKIQKGKTLTNNLIKNWDLIKTSPRVQVHICSIALQQFKRLSISDLQQRQIAQLTRIFKCIQTDCTIVYVTPFSLSPEIMRYYQKIFSLGSKGNSFREKLCVISVSRMLERISSHLTTVSALLYDSENIKKIKQIIKERQSPVMGNVCSYIIPSFPSNQYLNLSAELEIPIFSGPQSLCKLYSTKSGHYEFLKSVTETMNEKCPFYLPKSIHGIYSEKELINMLAVLIYKNKQIKKWMFKIDDQINSRGLAYLNVDSLAFLKQLRIQNQQNNEQKFSDMQIIALIAEELKVKLSLRLKILNKSVYPDYNSFLSHFLTRGGFLQACIEPEVKQGKTVKPIQHSISFLIEPNGEFKILTTYSRLQLGYKLINSAIECPSQLSATQVDNEKIVRTLYRHLWTKNKLFGYFTIDLLCIKGEITNKNYVIGLDCFLNEKTSSVFVPSLTSLIEYNKQKNKLFMGQILSDVKQRQNESLAKNSRIVTQQSFLSNMDEKVSQSRVIPSKIKDKDKQICYIYCPFIKILNLPPISEFFKLCKFNNISFDIQSKTGTLFLLQGGLENGCFGFMCIANTKQNLRQQGLKLVQFLSKQFRSNNTNKKSGTKIKQGSDEIGQLRGYLLNSLKKSKQTNLNFKRQDLNLQMIF